MMGQVDPSVSKAMSSVESKFSGLNKKALAAAAGAAAIGAAAIKAGKNLLELGGKFDTAMDSIRIGTGATGEALDALGEDFNAVYSNLPTDMEAASQAIADYNTRLGLTGEPLQNISKQAIQVADMLGDDLGTVIEESSQAFQQWQLDTENMGDAMDYIFKVSQSTGLGFTDIMGKMQQYGAQVQEMGYSFEEASVLIGQLDKAGVNVDETLGAMKKSVTTMAQKGYGASEGLEIYTQRIKEAGTAAEATTIAAEVFGTRAGSTMAAAIRNGSLSVEALTSELTASSESIAGAADDTYDYTEKMQMLKNRMNVALQPLANTVFDALNAVMPLVEKAMAHLTPLIGKVAQKFADFGGKLSPLIESARPAVKAIFNALRPVFQEVAQAASGIMQAIAPIIAQVLPELQAIAQVIAPILKATLGVAFEHIGTVVDTLMGVFQGLIQFIGGVFTGNWRKAWEGVKKVFGSIFEGLVNLVKKPFNAIISLINKAIGGINAIHIDIPDWVPAFGGKTLGFNIPKIPTLASGGFTNGVSIAGEAGMEAVISFDKAFRSANIGYWAKAGELLGAIPDGSRALWTGSGASGLASAAVSIVYAPSIQLTTSSAPDAKQGVLEALRENEEEFVDLMEEFLKRRGASAF